MDLDFKEEKEIPLAAPVKSSTRMLFEAQVEVIKSQIGDLEKIRENLGLSQRKICHLLMVDPSSWTRWTRWNESIPPHIYRALQWYMIIQEKIPGLTPQYFIGKDPEVLHQKAMISVQNLERKLSSIETENLALRKSIQILRKILGLTVSGAIAIGLFLLLYIHGKN